MKHMMKINAVGSALALAGVLAFSGQAVADTVTANLDLVGGKSGTINTSGGNGGGGLFSSSTQGGTYSGDLLPLGPGFLAFCLQPGETLNDNAVYTVTALQNAPVLTPGTPMGAAAETAMEVLLGNVFPVFSATQTVQNVDSTLGLSEAQEFMALQLAIWEIATERTDTVGNYNVSFNSGDFHADNGYNISIVSQANTWLAELGTQAWQANQLNNLVALVDDNDQDFVAQVVPIPAAAWLFGSAIVGAVALGRRKKKAEAQA